MLMDTLSRRERQILNILYQRSRATAAEIQAALPDPPSYSATRALLRILERKGHVRHVAEGPRYVFSPRLPKKRAQRTALVQLLNTFFNGSISDAVATLLDASAARLSPDELDRLDALIDRARKEGQS
jgi:predicted transcriptional regulator